MCFICQTCGNEINREHAKWLKEWNNSSGYGYSFICPICMEKTFVDQKSIPDQDETDFIDINYE